MTFLLYSFCPPFVPFFLFMVNKCFVCLCRGWGVGVFMHDREWVFFVMKRMRMNKCCLPWICVEDAIVEAVLVPHTEDGSICARIP